MSLTKKKYTVYNVCHISCHNSNVSAEKKKKKLLLIIDLHGAYLKKKKNDYTLLKNSTRNAEKKYDKEQQNAKNKKLLAIKLIKSRIQLIKIIYN